MFMYVRCPHFFFSFLFLTWGNSIKCFKPIERRFFCCVSAESPGLSRGGGGDPPGWRAGPEQSQGTGGQGQEEVQRITVP